MTNNKMPSSASYSSDDILSFLESNGNIDLRDVEERMRKARKESILKNHPYKIYQGKDGRWRTHLPDKDKSEGRKVIVKTHLDDLEQMICDHYEATHADKLKELCSLQDLYPSWLEYKSLHVEATTIMRIEKDWRKYYRDSDLVKKPICKITKTELDSWVHKNIRDHEMNKHKFGNFSLIIRQMLDYAVDNGIVENNLFESIRIDKKRVLKPERKKPDHTQVFNVDEEALMIGRALDSFEKKENYIQQLAPLALVFIFYTGLRIGEVSALRYEDIHGDNLIVSRAVRFPDGKITDHTKGTFGDREIPLIPAAKEIISATKQRRHEIGLDTKGYIFCPNESPLTTYKAIQHAITKYCEQLEIEKRSTHKIRKTMISRMYDGGINPNTVRKIAGHMDERTTLSNYCYDRSSDEMIISKLESALA